MNDDTDVAVIGRLSVGMDLQCPCVRFGWRFRCKEVTGQSCGDWQGDACIVNVTSDFECRNGKAIAEVEAGHWRFDEEGEAAPYCKYFCVRVDAGAHGGAVHLDI